LCGRTAAGRSPEPPRPFVTLPLDQIEQDALTDAAIGDP